MEVGLAGLIKFTAFSAALIALLVFVVIPVVAGPIISGLLRDAGLAGDDIDVSVEILGAEILSGRVPAMRLKAEDVEVRNATIGRLDVTLDGVSATDRSFGSISGTLWDVRVAGPGGLPIVLETVHLAGPAGSARATGTLDRSESQALVRAVAGQAGVTIDEVTLGDGILTLQQDGQTTEAQARLAGERLVLEMEGAEPVELLPPAPSGSWRVREVGITPDGMTVELSVDLRGLAGQLTPAP